MGGLFWPVSITKELLVLMNVKGVTLLKPWQGKPTIRWWWSGPVLAPHHPHQQLFYYADRAKALIECQVGGKYIDYFNNNDAV